VYNSHIHQLSEYLSIQYL